MSSPRDVTERIWDTGLGPKMALRRGHAGIVNGVAFSPAGRRLATAGSDARARPWPHLQGQEPIDQGCSKMVRPLGKAQREPYFRAATPAHLRCGRPRLPRSLP